MQDDLERCSSLASLDLQAWPGNHLNLQAWPGNPWEMGLLLKCLEMVSPICSSSIFSWKGKIINNVIKEDIYLSIHKFINPNIYLSKNLHIQEFIYLIINLSRYLSSNIYWPGYLSIQISIKPDIYLSKYLSIFLSIYLKLSKLIVLSRL